MKTKLFILTAACFVVVLSYFAISGSQTINAKESAMTKAEVQDIVKEYLSENPEIVIQAIKTYQMQEQERQQQAFKDELRKNKDKLVNNPDAPMAGNPDGDVTVVEFFDYNCGYCKKAIGDVVTLVEQDDQLKVVFMELPILSESSRDAARWALAAKEQGKYFEYHTALMKFSGPKTKSTLRRLAKDVGLDVEKLEKDADDPEISKILMKNQEMARSLGISGTQAFIIGDSLSPGYIPLDAMKAAVKSAREGKS